MWPEQFAQDDHCIMQAELKYGSEANLSISLSFLVFHQKLSAAGEPSKESGQPLECSRIAPLQLSHTCLSPFTQEGSLVLWFQKSSQQLILKDCCFILSILRSQVKEPTNSGNQVNKFSAKPAISARKNCHTWLQISLSLDNHDSTFIKFSSTFPPGKNTNHYSHLKGQ